MERRFAVHAGPGGTQALTRRRAARGWPIALVALALVAAAGTADARPKRRDARQAFDRGVSLYQKGNYQGASDALGRSFELEHDADTLFAWAQAERKLDHCDKATVLYEQLLTFTLPVANRTAVEQKLAECRSLATPPPPPAPPPEPVAPPVAPPPVAAPPPLERSEPPPVAAPSPVVDRPEAPASEPARRTWYRDPVALSLLGAGVVAGGVGTGFLVAARSASNGSKSAVDYSSANGLKDKAQQRGAIGLATAIGGGVLIGGGVVWIVLHRDPTEQRTVTGWLAPGGGGLAITGPF